MIWGQRDTKEGQVDKFCHLNGLICLLQVSHLIHVFLT